MNEKYSAILVDPSIFNETKILLKDPFELHIIPVVRNKVWTVKV